MKQNYKIDKLLLELSSNGGSCSVDDGNGSSTPIVVEGDTLYPQSLKATKEKVIYNQDEILNLDDLIVECTYTDGSTAIIKNYATNVNEIDMGFAGYKPLTITYCHNGIEVSAKVNINVKNTDSYNNTQLAYKIVRTGTLKAGQAVVTCLDKIMQYSKLKFRIKAKFVVEQNYTKTGCSFGFGENTLFGNKFMGGQVHVNANQVGEFMLNTTLDIDFTRKTISKGTNIIYLTNNGYDNVQGYFELLDVSLVYTEPVAKVPMSISASKVITRAIIGEDFISDDITATVTYNDESTANVTPVIKLPDELTVGDNAITVEYSAENRTVTTTLNMHYYKKDKTEPDEFHDMTAREWCEAWHMGINWGNSLDSKANSNNKLDGDTTHKGDTYVDFQETCWGQPAATLKNFQDIKAKGFDMVRIPVTWCYNSYTEPERDENDLKVRHIGKFWACRVAEVVDLALEAGLYVMINMHHEQPIIFTASTKTAMKQVYKDVEQCWTEIAEKFKHYNEKLCFEGFNEVDNLEKSWQYGKKAATQMNDLNQIFVNAVRKTGSNNAKRVLHCPTLIHSSDNRCINDWVYPNDTVENHIAMNVHIYDAKFLQNLDASFETLEHWSDLKGVPICIGEWGTEAKNGSYDFRARHAQNYVARAKYHHLYPIFWDNGSSYELVKKYNRIHEYNHPFEELQKIIDGIHKGYYEMKAFRVPDEKLIVLDDPSVFEYNQWEPTKGYYWTGWGYCSTHTYKAFPNASYIVEVERTGQAAADFLQLQAVRFMKTITLEDGSIEYEILETVGGSWHNSYVSGKVPEEADCILVTMTCADKKVEGKGAWQPYFDNGELALTIMQYDDADITEEQLTYRTPQELIAIKDVTSYLNLNSQLDTSDITASVKYSDGYTKTLNLENITIDTSKVDMSKKGQYYITVKATVENIELTAQIEILVGALLAEISAEPTELIAKIGNSSLDTSNIMVIAKYTDDSTSILEAGTYTIDTSAVKFDEIGIYDIVITYTEFSIERTCTITCEIYDKLECKIGHKDKSYYEPYAPDGQLDPIFNNIEPNACEIWNIVAHRYDKLFTSAPVIYTDSTRISWSTLKDEYHLYIPNKYITQRYAAWDNKNNCQAKYRTSLSSQAEEGQAIKGEIITDSLNREWLKLSFIPPVNSDFTKVSNKLTVVNVTMPVYVTSEADLGTIEIAEDTPIGEENVEINN